MNPKIYDNMGNLKTQIQLHNERSGRSTDRNNRELVRKSWNAARFMEGGRKKESQHELLSSRFLMDVAGLHRRGRGRV